MFGSLESIILIFNAYLFNLKKGFPFSLNSSKFDSFNFKNFFLKKLWTSRNRFSSINFSLYGSTIHYPLKMLKVWNNPVRFIFKCKLFPIIQSINRLSLKNVFLKTFDDLDLWFEIEKMIDSNLVGFTNEFIVCITKNVIFEIIFFL